MATVASSVAHWTDTTTVDFLLNWGGLKLWRIWPTAFSKVCQKPKPRSSEQTFWPQFPSVRTCHESFLSCKSGCMNAL